MLLRPAEKLLFPVNVHGKPLKSYIEITNLTKRQISYKVGIYTRQTSTDLVAVHSSPTKPLTVLT